MHQPMGVIKHMQATARKDYKRVKPTAKKREIFLEKRAQSYEKLEKDKLAQKLQGISKADILNEAQQEVKFELKPHGTSNILHIEVTDPDLPGKIKDIHDQGDIETEMKNM